MPKKQTRSIKLRKYEEAYKSCIKRQNKKEKSPRPQRRKPQKSPARIERSKKKPLNKYQKFVREQSKKTIYKNMTGPERLTAISKKWNKINRKK